MYIILHLQPHAICYVQISKTCIGCLSQVFVCDGAHLFLFGRLMFVQQSQWLTVVDVLLFDLIWKNYYTICLYSGLAIFYTIGEFVELTAQNELCTCSMMLSTVGCIEGDELL